MKTTKSNVPSFESLPSRYRARRSNMGPAAEAMRARYKTARGLGYLLRGAALSLVLVGIAAFLFPQYEESVPFHLVVTHDNLHLLGVILVGLGVVTFLLSRE